MDKINFKDGASGGTPLNAENLNQMQTNAENAINEVGTQATSEIELLKAQDESLTAEIELLRNQIPTGTATGESIILNDSSNLPFKSLIPKGKSVQNGTPTLDTPIEIENVEEDVAVKVTGKNLLPYPFANSTKTHNGITFTDNGDGTITINGTATNSAFIVLQSKAEYGATIDGKTLGTNGTYAVPKTSVDTAYMFYNATNKTLSLNVNSGVTIKNLLFKPQIALGTEVSEWEPYKEQTATFPLAEGQKLMEGSYLADDGVHNVRGQKILDGSDDEGWVDNAVSNHYSIHKNKFINVNAPSGSTNTLCSHFVNVTSGNSNAGRFYTGGSYFNFNNNGFATLSEFKQWLSNNPITVEYELAEEEIVPYTEEQQEAWNNIKKLTSYKNTTNILTSSETEVIYYKDLETMFNNINTAIVSLGGV